MPPSPRAVTTHDARRGLTASAFASLLARLARRLAEGEALKSARRLQPVLPSAPPRRRSAAEPSVMATITPSRLNPCADGATWDR
jgi:hypothetical protein